MRTIERTQTGVRIEKRLLKVLKGLAEHADMSLRSEEHTSELQSH